MANRDTNLDLLSAGQAQKELTANQLFDASSPATLYGRRGTTTALLTWGYYGGILNGVTDELPNGIIQLNPSATNYIEAEPKKGTVLCNTQGFTKDYIPLYIVITDTSSVVDYKDKRPNPLISGGGGGGGSYTLPIASATELGGIKVGKNLTINPMTGVIDGLNAYTLPTASTTILGGIKIGKNLTINADGTVDANTGGYTLPIATSTALGGIKVGSTLSINATSGVLDYILPTASSTVKGGIKIGKNLTITGDVLDGPNGLTKLEEVFKTTTGFPLITLQLQNGTSNNFCLNTGSGAFQLTPNGQIRGLSSIDLQAVMNTNDVGAGGQYCSILGGRYNNISVGTTTSYIQGNSNNINGTGQYVFINGLNNTSTDSSYTYIIGEYNDSTNSNTDYIYGQRNTVNNSSGVNLFGNSNNFNYGSYVWVVGNNNKCDFSVGYGKPAADIIIGNNAKIKKNAPSVSLGGDGNSQYNIYSLSKIANRDEMVYLCFGGSNDYPNSQSYNIDLENDELRAFKGIVTAKSEDKVGVVASWEIKGAVYKDNNGDMSFVSPPKIEKIASTQSADQNIVFYGMDCNRWFGIQLFHSYANPVKFSAVIEMLEIN